MILPFYTPWAQKFYYTSWEMSRQSCEFLHFAAKTLVRGERHIPNVVLSYSRIIMVFLSNLYTYFRCLKSFSYSIFAICAVRCTNLQLQIIILSCIKYSSRILQRPRSAPPWLAAPRATRRAPPRAWSVSSPRRSRRRRPQVHLVAADPGEHNLRFPPPSSRRLEKLSEPSKRDQLATQLVDCFASNEQYTNTNKVVRVRRGAHIFVSDFATMFVNDISQYASHS